MFSHVTVGTSDLERAGIFYDAVLLPLGLVQRPVTPDGGPKSLCWITPNQTLPRFYVYAPFNGQAATAGNGCMLAFLADSPDAVARAHTAGVAMGETDEGAPGERLQYGRGYFGAYLRDPDGNKIHIAYRGDLN
jgi:catechol 2,3-dioxygenase-like lactoylglutathione lyase family enzyme